MIMKSVANKQKSAYLILRDMDEVVAQFYLSRRFGLIQRVLRWSISSART